MKSLLALICALALVGCSAQGSSGDVTTSEAQSTTSGTTATASDQSSTKPEDNLASQTTPSQSADDPAKRMPKDGDEVAVLNTNLGKIVLMFFPDKAPNHVANFKKLAKKGFYDGTKFHRVIPGFMIQGGDPNSKNADRNDDGQGGPGYEIKNEFNDVHHGRGILSMARTQDPDSAGSQFFICVADADTLDHQYTAFGRCIEGMDVVDKIVNLPTDPATNNPLPENPAIVKSVKIEKWPLKK